MGLRKAVAHCGWRCRLVPFLYQMGHSHSCAKSAFLSMSPRATADVRYRLERPTLLMPHGDGDDRSDHHRAITVRKGPDMASIRYRLNEIIAEELTKRIAQAVKDQQELGVDARLPEEAIQSIRREIIVFLAEIHTW